MATTSVGVPFPVYTDTSGDPVDAGYLYLGAAGLNPEVNPIQAYWDAELTTPAAQPVRTSGGYAMRGGSPGRLYIAAADYSITLKDKNSRLVWSSLDGADLGADLQSQLSFTTTLFTAVGGETVLSTGVAYTSEMLYVDQNGLGLYSGVHFSETTSTTITLTTPATAGDVFRIRVGQFISQGAVAEAQAVMDTHEAAADPHPGYVTTAEGAALITAHEAAADPHPGYVLESDLVSPSLTQLSETTLSEGVWINKAHSLGVVPSRVLVSLRCKTSEHGYSVNDEILFSSGYNTAFATDRRAVVMNSTNVSFFFSAYTIFPDKTTGAPCTLTTASWAIVVRVGV